MSDILHEDRRPGDAPYGYCPKCGGEGCSRERRPNGNDECSRGHVYPSSTATPDPNPTPLFKTVDELHAPEAQQIVALGTNPILADVAQMHEPLTRVRAAVAEALTQVSPGAAPVFAFSIISAGVEVADQLIVFSPGGDKLRNANEALKRLRAATEQMETLVNAGAFGG